ncbi:hypothetical protein EXN66_Car002391 [Channa argus]|uniref:Uncharacterized protein n=1 Tax=Channa argus TaxID=215402 RepID=A0A6G1P936_CHAAH|nr:hypothetical protein EXN66_Car002391 [Channa argus]
MATSMDTLPAHLLPLVMEEFPQSLATACVCRAGQLWHHRGGGGGLLHPGGRPGSAILPADCGEPEEEYQMSCSRESTSTTATRLTYLASLQPVWRPTDIYSVMDADCADLKTCGW